MSQVVLTPESSNRFVLERVLHASLRDVAKDKKKRLVRKDNDIMARHRCDSDVESCEKQKLCGNRLVEEFFMRTLSSSRYLSHIRSPLRLLETPVGVLAATAEMICGATKLSRGSVRFKPRAEANIQSFGEQCTERFR